MNRWIMIIDIEKCENCNNCFLACKDEHFENDWLPHTLAQPRHGHRWMNILRKEQGTFPYISVAYLPKPCFHCGDAPCVKRAANGEIFKRPDGIVMIDPEKSQGNQDLVSACPHGAIWWNDENNTPQKCTLCVHLLEDGWKQPRCAQACPTGALTFHAVPEKDLEEFVGSNALEMFSDQNGRLDNIIEADGVNENGDEDQDKDETAQTHVCHAPMVLYKNLDLYRKCFISGSIATEKNGVQECVEGVVVELLQNGAQIGCEQSDVFGDYRFSGLMENSGTYDIKMTLHNSIVGQSKIELTRSCFAGTTWI